MSQGNTSLTVCMSVKTECGRSNIGQVFPRERVFDIIVPKIVSVTEVRALMTCYNKHYERGLIEAFTHHDAINMEDGANYVACYAWHFTVTTTGYTEDLCYLTKEGAETARKSIMDTVNMFWSNRIHLDIEESVME